MNSRFRFLLFFMVVVTSSDCSRDSDLRCYHLSGSWNAHWQLTDTTMSGIFTADQLAMDGELTFRKNNRILIRAFGFRGCAFAADTAENELIYQRHDSLLNMINESRDIVFSYRITSYQPDHIQLDLMNDIRLELTRGVKAESR